MKKERVIRNLISAVVFMAMFWGISGSMRLKVSLPVILVSGAVYFLFYTAWDWYKLQRGKQPGSRPPQEK